MSTTRKVNEYEGQHRLAGQDPEVPVSPNLVAGGDKVHEMPVVSDLTTAPDDRSVAKVVVEGE